MLTPQVFWQAHKAGLITTKKGKRDKLLFGLTIPRYLLKDELAQIKGEATSIEIDTVSKRQSQPKAAATKQQKTVPV